MKKLQPIDSLTEQDKYNIRKYIYLYSNCECGPLDIVLQEWNKSKRRLYHAFGNKLTIEKTITLEKDTAKVYRRLKDLYSYLCIFYERDFDYLQAINKDNFSTFYGDFASFVRNVDNLSFEEKSLILSLFDYKYIINGYIDDKSFKLQNYSFSVQKGAKTIRTIRKCVKALRYSNNVLFESWISAVNTISSNQIEKAKLIISINPIDFITMSDNACKWSSCMSWINNGCYHAGTIEMMNSNITAIAYLKAEKDFIINLDENNNLTIPNKSWRMLLYCHKDILLAGKSYPYGNDILSRKALHFLKETIEHSFNWKYKYGPQPYMDIMHFHKNSFLKNYCVPDYNGKNKIIIHTNGMYNDLIEDTSLNYWCYRNKTKGIKICLSGKLTCVCCGKEIESHEYLNSPEDIRTSKICYKCSQKKCPICGTIVYKTDNKYNLCSDACKNNAVIFLGQKCVISKTDFLSNSDISYFLFIKNTTMLDKIYRILRKEDFSKDFSIYSVEKMFLKYDVFKGKDYLIRKVPQVFIKKNMVNIHSAELKVGLWDKYSCKNNFYLFNCIRTMFYPGNTYPPFKSTNNYAIKELDKIESLKDFYYYKEGELN